MSFIIGWCSSVADLGGVPRVPEPPFVELDTKQADRRLRRRACVHATYVRMRLS